MIKKQATPTNGVDFSSPFGALEKMFFFRHGITGGDEKLLSDGGFASVVKLRGMMLELIDVEKKTVIVSSMALRALHTSSVLAELHPNGYFKASLYSEIYFSVQTCQHIEDGPASMFARVLGIATKMDAVNLIFVGHGGVPAALAEIAHDTIFRDFGAPFESFDRKLEVEFHASGYCVERKSGEVMTLNPHDS